MIDLHSDMDTLIKYVEKYNNYLPQTSDNVQRRMEFSYRHKIAGQDMTKILKKTGTSLRLIIVLCPLCEIVVLVR